MLPPLIELPGRQATESMRRRIGLAYALVMERDEPRFRHSVLADSRERFPSG